MSSFFSAATSRARTSGEWPTARPRSPAGPGTCSWSTSLAAPEQTPNSKSAATSQASPSVNGPPPGPNTAHNTSAPVSATVKRPNSPPTIAKANASATVNEGQTAANGGPYSVPNGDTVTITASVGTVTKTGTSSGTWSWSFVTTDGPAQSQTVTITANDGHGGTTTTTFGLTVNNVAPTATFAATSPINEGSSSTLDVTSPA